MKRTETFKQYILECIDSQYYDVETKTDEDKVNFLYNTFKSEYGWSISRYGWQRALKEYFQGLPGSCPIMFYNHEIISWLEGNELLSKKSSEDEIYRAIENYWIELGVAGYELFKQYGLINN